MARPRLRQMAACTALLIASAAVAGPADAQGQRGCAGEPGGPDQGAIFQYCPSEAKRPPQGGASADGSAEPGTPAAGTSTGGGTGGGGVAGEAAGGGTELPLTGFPSSGGLNAMAFVLLVALAAATVAYGVRRRQRRAAEAQS